MHPLIYEIIQNIIKHTPILHKSIQNQNKPYKILHKSYKESFNIMHKPNMNFMKNKTHITQKHKTRHIILQDHIKPKKNIIQNIQKS